MPGISLRRYEFPPAVAALPSWLRAQLVLPPDQRSPALLSQMATALARQATDPKRLPSARGPISPGAQRALEIAGYLVQAASNPVLLPVSIAATEIAKEIAKSRMRRAVRRVRHKIARTLFEAYRLGPAIQPRSVPYGF